LKAFDRLEVAERAAQTVLYSLSIGKIIPLNKEQVDDLEKNFPVA
jgi:ribulose-5-phosphate 4-epimerase/fuculose-1-phosphate aldolase